MTQLYLFPIEAHLTRIEPTENMCRFYALQIVSDLFGGYALTRSWGRIGQSSTVWIELHDTESAAIGALQAWRDRKWLRGYRQK